MNCLQVGQSPLGVAVVILVIRSARSCVRIRPVLRSTTPPGVLSSHGSASHSSVVAACLRSARARRSTPPTVPALANLAATLGLSARTAVWRQTLRIKSVAASVSSVRQRCPSQTSHLPQPAT